jgi:two-component system sensor histidine kinase KdpD
MADTRQKPEEILARIQEEEASQLRGKLKIFLGAAAGVGKTYTMLEAARKLQSDGVDVVAGVVVTHGRKETEKLLDGIEVIPATTVEYKGSTLEELNLDEILKRRPQVVLADELAHTNAPGSRHEKRWQDVEEILQAGISVYTTLNIQHLESVNDLIDQITGVRVRETVPDSIFDKAYEVELVDLPPDDLIQRLKEGKVYLPEQSQIALENFFKKGNLIALRELALRSTAQRVDAQMLKYRQEQSVADVWPITDRLLVCVGPSPLSARLVRATKRMADGLRAEWMAVYVETPKSTRLPEKAKTRVIRTLQIAQRLGAETTRISGENTPEELITYARKRNVSKIVIGKPARPRWREILFGSVVDELIRKSGNIDVYVITGDNVPQEATTVSTTHREFDFRSYLYSIGLIALATVLAKLTFKHLATVNLAMIYQLAIVVIAVRFGKGPSIMAAFLGVATFDFFFVEPYLSFAVSDTQYILTFIVMLIVGLALSTLTSTVKSQAELARKREHQTAALYAMTCDQETSPTTRAVVDASVKHISDLFECKVAVWLGTHDNEVALAPHSQPSFEPDNKETGVAQWVFINQQPAGATTGTLSGAKALYLPMRGSRGKIGVLGLLPSSYERLGNPDEMHLLETFVNQTALAVECAQLAERMGATDSAV